MHSIVWVDDIVQGFGEQCAEVVYDFSSNLDVVSINLGLLEVFTMSDVCWNEEIKIGIDVQWVVDGTDNNGDICTIIA